MNLQQFRFTLEAVHRNFNLTEVALALNTSQPGVSKAILELEDELGLCIFKRHGKRITGLTPVGSELMGHLRLIMQEVGNVKRFADNYSNADEGTLSIATTHTQARYTLPEPITWFRKKFPKVNISLHQGTPEQVVQMVLKDVADVGLATEALSSFDGLVSFPCYEWHHMLVFPVEHRFAKQVELISLEQLCQEQIVTYEQSFAGRKRVDAAFARHGLTPKIALDALDSDVIKTYVKLGMGVGIVAEMATQDLSPASLKEGLLARSAKHLFGTNTAKLAFRRGVLLRDYWYDFAQKINSDLTRERINAAMNDQDYLEFDT